MLGMEGSRPVSSCYFLVLVLEGAASILVLVSKELALTPSLIWQIFITFLLVF